MSEQLSEHFKRGEFACHCGCGGDEVSMKLIELLEEIRTFFGKPISITSGFRCEAYNKAVGGAKASQHCQGIAADIQVHGVPAPQVFRKLEEHFGTRIGGMGSYPNWVHVDVRSGHARW